LPLLYSCLPRQLRRQKSTPMYRGLMWMAQRYRGTEWAQRALEGPGLRARRARWGMVDMAAVGGLLHDRMRGSLLCVLPVSNSVIARSKSQHGIQSQ
jgi:hypothetical protein